MGRLRVKADYENLKSWKKTRLGWPVLDYKMESFKHHNQRRENITKWTTYLRRSNRLKGYSAPSPKGDVGLKALLTPEALAQHSNRLKIDVRCHFCREKELCGEEDRKRCGDLDMDQLCLGKMDCSICHSSNGLLCRGCLKNRYGEVLKPCKYVMELEEVRANKGWVCPHFTEEKGINPYWICNRSSCLKKRKMAPTGNTTLKARKMGYKSVAHLLMDQLQVAVKRR